jgi:hypothetical protein
MTSRFPRSILSYNEVHFTGAVKVERDGTIHGAVEVRQVGERVHVKGGSVAALGAAIERVRKAAPVRIGPFTIALDPLGRLVVDAEDRESLITVNGVTGPLGGLRFSHSVSSMRHPFRAAQGFKFDGGQFGNINCGAGASVEVDGAVLAANLVVSMERDSCFVLPPVRFQSLNLVAVGQSTFTGRGAYVDRLRASMHGESMLAYLTIGGACHITAMENARVDVCALDWTQVTVGAGSTGTVNARCANTCERSAPPEQRAVTSKRALSLGDYDDMPTIHIDNLDGLAVGDDAADIIAAVPEPTEKRARTTK